jgi:hypothetical protein
MQERQTLAFRRSQTMHARLTITMYVGRMDVDTVT